MKTDAVGGLAGEVKPPRNEPLPSPGGVLLALIGRYDENVGRFARGLRDQAAAPCAHSSAGVDLLGVRRGTIGTLTRVNP